MTMSLLHSARRVAAPAVYRSFHSSVPLASVAQLPYKAPVREMNFVMNETLDAPAHWQKHGYTDATPDVVDEYNQLAAQFAEKELAPLYSVGDIEGCQRDEAYPHDVTTPSGFKEAFQSMAEQGWQGLSVPEKYNGSGQPPSVSILKTEIFGAANWAWNMYPGLTMGAINTMMLHANEQQKMDYLVPMVEGQWTGTMCLTEPQCGTDLGLVKTKAEPMGDVNGAPAYKLNGTKIWISSGEHDMAENIVHIVLARLPGAPAGTRGISLFLVPKYIKKEDGALDTTKNITCGGLEKKMGIHGNATCVMNFEDSVGWLIGTENKGLNHMFTFMNTARLGTALQGICHAERAQQAALWFARERRAMRSLTGPKFPDLDADPILVHPDVRKNLMYIKAVTEGGRAMCYDAALLADGMLDEDKAKRDACDDELGLYTPILKAFLTEQGQVCASLAMQVYGGMGFTKDANVEQIMRDALISTKYEGTTGVQALDLLGRKVLLGKGKQLWKCCKKMGGEAASIGLKSSSRTHGLVGHSATVASLTSQWLLLTGKVMAGAAQDREMVGSASVDYLFFAGYTHMAYQWLRMMSAAADALAKHPDMGEEDKLFYEAKLKTGDFYFRRMAPMAQGHYSAASQSPDTVMSLSDREFDIANDLPSTPAPGRDAFGPGWAAEGGEPQTAY